MQLDRDLGKTIEGRICSLYAPECAFLVARKGAIFSDADAEKLGILRYLDECRREEARAERVRALESAKAAVESKAVTPTEPGVEDKAVAGPGALQIIADAAPETRRVGARR